MAVRPDSEEKFETSSGGFELFPSLSDEATVDLSVIVPAYNEELRIHVMLDECLEHLRGMKISSEVLVVDDGSRDRTAQVVLGYVRTHGDGKIRLLQLQQNQGKGGAVRMGMLRSRGNLLLMADADGATRFADVDRMLAAVQPHESLAVVVGSRRQSERETGRSLFRLFFSYGFNMYTKLVGGVYGIEDTQCGFKLFTRQAARNVFPQMRLRRWAFDVESLYLAQAAGSRLASVDVQWTEIPGSKLSVFKTVKNMARDVFLMRWNYATGRWKVMTAR